MGYLGSVLSSDRWEASLWSALQVIDQISDSPSPPFLSPAPISLAVCAYLSFSRFPRLVWGTSPMLSSLSSDSHLFRVLFLIECTETHIAVITTCWPLSAHREFLTFQQAPASFSQAISHELWVGFQNFTLSAVSIPQVSCTPLRSSWSSFLWLLVVRAATRSHVPCLPFRFHDSLSMLDYGAALPLDLRSWYELSRTALRSA